LATVVKKIAGANAESKAGSMGNLNNNLIK
jgi:hypothetical protein